MIIRAYNGNILHIGEIDSIYNYNNNNDYYEIWINYYLDNDQKTHTIYKSNSEEERDKVIEKIWDRIKLGDNLIDIKIIVDSLYL